MSPELHQMTPSSWRRPHYEPHVNLWQRSLADPGGEEAQLRRRERETHLSGIKKLLFFFLLIKACELSCFFSLCEYVQTSKNNDRRAAL